MAEFDQKGARRGHWDFSPDKCPTPKDFLLSFIIVSERIVVGRIDFGKTWLRLTGLSSKVDRCPLAGFWQSIGVNPGKPHDIWN